MAKVTGIVDYHAGNIKSVERACRAVGAEYVISDNPRDLQNAARLIVPGVGEAAYAMQELKKTGFDRFIKDAAAGRNSVQALQFHPEKSGTPGLKILANFTGAALQKAEMSNA